MLCGNPFSTTAKNFRVFASKRKIEINEAVPGSACLQFEQTEMNFNLARSMRRQRPFSEHFYAASRSCKSFDESLVSTILCGIHLPIKRGFQKAANHSLLRTPRVSARCCD
ncbi:hypothetical protein RE6C_05054 [Rhodopirellula europaea 6C]|uniref:Uncharacterized protein n=1 Tax=Rhodopirellula europaea 6C TaxID=1263867 RepID=M2AXB4_9BACT|nr:hypothetical protein RE6C_05054 [Rhodopirellula europaea 6C]